MPGGDPVGPRVPSAYAVRDVVQAGEGLVGVGAERCDGHDAAQLEQPRGRNGVREAAGVRGQHAAA